MNEYVIKIPIRYTKLIVIEDLKSQRLPTEVDDSDIFRPMGSHLAKFWAGNYAYNVLHDVAGRVNESHASSSLIERSFSIIGRYVTKEFNSRMSKNLCGFVQVNEFDKFQKVMKEVFAMESITYKEMTLYDGTSIEQIDAEAEETEH